MVSGGLLVGGVARRNTESKYSNVRVGYGARHRPLSCHVHCYSLTRDVGCICHYDPTPMSVAFSGMGRFQIVKMSLSFTSVGWRASPTE